MPINNRPTYTSDGGGGGTTKKNTSTNTNPYGNNTGVYGSQYGGASAGNTGSNMGLYGSQYGGASQNNKSNSSSSSKSSGQGFKPTVVNNRVTTGKNNPTPVVPGTSGNGNGGGSKSSSASSGGGSGYTITGPANTGTTSSTDDVLKKIRAYLEEQYNKANEYQATLRDQGYAEAEKNATENRERANLAYKQADRRISNMYGNDISGAGLSNISRNSTNWANNLNNINRDYATARQSVLANYNNALSNNASTLANGWYNYILPIYTNREINANDLDYRKYIANLFG